jgi:beta-galactosidase
MESSNFSPKVGLEPGQVRDLFTEPPAIAALGGKIVKADSEAPGYEAVRAIDGDPTTIWHTPWEGEVLDFPHEIQVDLGKPVTITGFRYLPRQDMTNGRVAEFELYISGTGADWGSPVAKGTFKNDSHSETVRFARAHVGQFLRFVALKEVNGKQFVSVAELDIILEE